LEQKHGRPVHPEEVGAALRIDTTSVQVAARYARKHRSLDAGAMPGGASPLISTLEDRVSPAPDAATERKSTARAVGEMLSVLTKEERVVLKLYFGIDQDMAYSLRQISTRYGVKRERVRKIKDTAIGKLRACDSFTRMARELTRAS
jgi:RNA polymerase primary sigma factor